MNAFNELVSTVPSRPCVSSYRTGSQFDPSVHSLDLFLHTPRPAPDFLSIWPGFCRLSLTFSEPPIPRTGALHLTNSDDHFKTCHHWSERAPHELPRVQFQWINRRVFLLFFAFCTSIFSEPNSHEISPIEHSKQGELCVSHDFLTALGFIHR
jgi:hypothetical protein